MAVLKHRSDRGSVAPSTRARVHKRWQALSANVQKPRARLLSKLVLTLALLIGAYALLGFVVAPRVLRAQLTALVHDHYGRTLGLGEVRVNPFKLWVELRDVALPDVDGKPLARVGRLFVDVQGPASLWERALVFREITVERPELRAIVRRDGALNFADLARPKAAAKPEPKAKKSELPALWVQTLSIERGTLGFVDRAREKPFADALTPISFTLRDFRTNARGGIFGLTASTSDGARLAWRGKLALTPSIASAGELSIARVPLRKAAEYLADALPFRLLSGMLELKGSYVLELGKHGRTRVNLARIAVDELAVRARDQSAAVRIAGIELLDTRLALEQKAVEVARLVVRKLHTQAILEADGSLNLTRLAGGPASDANNGAASRDANNGAASRDANNGAARAGAATHADRDHAQTSSGGAAAKSAQPTKSAQAAWAAKIASFELEDATVALEDRAPAGGARMTFAPIDVTVKDVTLDPRQPLALSASVGLDEGRVRAEGKLTPEPLAAELDLRIDDLPLPNAQPYLSEYTNLTLKEGKLGVDGRLALAAGETTSKLSFAGDVAIHDFRTIDNELRQDLLAFQALELKRVRFDNEPRALEIDHVRLRAPYARVVLSKDQKLNVISAFTPKPEAKRAPSTERAAEPEHPAVQAPPANTAAKQAKSDGPFPIRVRTIAIDKLRMNFSDYFSQPNFAADMQELSGTVRGLSSDPRASAKVDLKGHLGENSPVLIAGTLRPFAYDKNTDLQLRLENVSLPIFNPYSGRFAGYNIARGELSTDIHYRLQNRELEAEHGIRIDQLTWGEATATKEKAPLPVKLATALLRDRHGVIKLDIPLHGTLDDPKFRVWPLIWQVVKNILVKAATAPFDLLASLFKGAEKAKSIDFEPGTAELESGAKQALEALAKALADRPQLKVDVPVGTVAELDRKGLAQQKFLERRAQKLRKKTKGQGEADFDTLAIDDKLDLLSEIYEDVTGNGPSFPDPPKPPENASRKEARSLRKDFEVEYLERATRDKIKISDEDLEVLGRARGEAIERTLLDAGQIETNRVLLSTEGKVTSDHGRVRFALDLK